VTERLFSVLILCTGNSARSILAESLINKKGAGRFVAHSAGSFPKGQVHPQSLSVLEHHGHPTEGLSSKSWDVFAEPGAPPIDAVITVCDNAAGEMCPIWPGAPLKAHWGVPDPPSATGPETAPAFELTYAKLEKRVDALIALPVESMDRDALKASLDAIGKTIDA
jgi:protein-tyrosine-phosphatase